MPSLRWRSVVRVTSGAFFLFKPSQEWISVYIKQSTKHGLWAVRSIRKAGWVWAESGASGTSSCVYQGQQTRILNWPAHSAYCYSMPTQILTNEVLFPAESQSNPMSC